MKRLGKEAGLGMLRSGLKEMWISFLEGREEMLWMTMFMRFPGLGAY